MKRKPGVALLFAIFASGNACERGLAGKPCPCVDERGDVCCFGTCVAPGECADLRAGSGGMPNPPDAMAGSGGATGGTGDGGSSAGARSVEAPGALRASTDVARAVRLDWEAAAARPDGYRILRDGEELARVGADSLVYEDESAAPGGIGAPALESDAGDSAPGTVRLRWSTPEPWPGQTHWYVVVAYVDDHGQELQSEASNVALGARRAPEVLGYEFSRDDGASWHDAGSGNEVEDLEALPGRLTARVEAVFEPWNAATRLALSDPPELVPALAPYRVRALTDAGAAQASAASARSTTSGEISYVWERSEGDADAAYAPLPEVTGALWFDWAPPFEAARYYQVVMDAAGAQGVSWPARAEARRIHAVAAGARHACGIRLDGSVHCWGPNERARGQPPNDDFTALAAGWAHTCGIRLDGTLACWGEDGAGQASPPSGTFTAISASIEHTCGLRVDGTAACWGANDDGQSSPPPGTFSSVVASRYYSCGIQLDGTVACWGNSNYWAPLPSSKFRALALATWSEYACGLAESGSVECWGSSTARRQAPEGPFSAIAAGVLTCGVRAGALPCWGEPLNVLDGVIKETPGRYTAPVGDFTSVSAFDHSACGVRTDQTVGCWKIGGDGLYVHETVRMSARGPFAAIAAGDNFVCAIDRAGELECSGGNVHDWASPPAGRFRGVAASDDYICAIHDDDSLDCFGLNAAMIEAAPRGAFESVALGSTYACAVRTDGTLACWGDRPDAPPQGEFTAVAVGSSACGLRRNGQITCWSGMPEPPASLRFQSVAVQFDYACGVKRDGALTCWGEDDRTGFLAVLPDGPFTAIELAMDFACGLRSNGEVECWGPSQGLPPHAARYESFTALSATHGFACGLLRDGRLWCWSGGNLL